MQRNSKKENFINRLELPKDVLLCDAGIRMCENRELLVENHRGLLLFEPDKMIVLTEHVTLTIIGRGLNAARLDSDIIKICGSITGIEFREC